jgi:hypothetical protein
MAGLPPPSGSEARPGPTARSAYAPDTAATAPLPHRHLRDHRIAKPRRRIHAARRPARRAEAAALARERHHVVVATAVAVHSREAVRQHATPQERRHLPQAERRHRPFPGFHSAHEPPAGHLHRAVQNGPLGFAPSSSAFLRAQGGQRARTPAAVAAKQQFAHSLRNGSPEPPKLTRFRPRTSRVPPAR